MTTTNRTAEIFSCTLMAGGQSAAWWHHSGAAVQVRAVEQAVHQDQGRKDQQAGDNAESAVCMMFTGQAGLGLQQLDGDQDDGVAQGVLAERSPPRCPGPAPASGGSGPPSHTSAP